MFRVKNVRDLYVIKNLVSSGDIATKGDMKICTDVANEKVYFQIYGGNGKLRSDVINPKHINYACSKAADDMAIKLKQVVVELDSTINSGNPIPGETYDVMGIFPNIGVDSATSTATKEASLYVPATMTASKFYLKLARLIAENFNSRSAKIFDVYVTEEASNKGTNPATWSKVTMDSINTPTSAYTGIIISERSPKEDYKRGVYAISNTQFTLSSGVVNYNSSEVVPFVTNDMKEFSVVDKVPFDANDDAVIKNGYELADLEYFAMGERGNLERNYNPYTSPAIKWMIDEESEYDMITISHYRQGWGTDIQHQDKQIELAVYNTSGHTTTNAIISALNTALGTTIPSL